jgi:hypothetical protein
MEAVRGTRLRYPTKCKSLVGPSARTPFVWRRRFRVDLMKRLSAWTTERAGQSHRSLMEFSELMTTQFAAQVFAWCWETRVGVAQVIVTTESSTSRRLMRRTDPSPRFRTNA